MKKPTKNIAAVVHELIAPTAEELELECHEGDERTLPKRNIELEYPGEYERYCKADKKIYESAKKALTAPYLKIVFFNTLPYESCQTVTEGGAEYGDAEWVYHIGNEDAY